MVASDLAWTEEETAALKRAYLLGLARTPAPRSGGANGDPALSDLTTLALLAARDRFRLLPVPAVPAEPRRLPDDPRPILPEPARQRLLRLLVGTDRGAGRQTAEIAMPGVLRLLARYGVRPHPFDLPRLEPWLRRFDERLGPTERTFLAWRQAALAEGAPRAGLLDVGPITAGNWTGHGKAARLAFLTDLRRTDPEAARGLLEACFADEPAALRAELLAALHAGLGPRDRAFLDGLREDRAGSVREAAAGLLARLPGSPEHEARLTAAAGAFSIERVGLLRRRQVLSFRLPTPPARPHQRPQAMADLLGGVGLLDLAGRMGLAPTTLVGLLPDDRGLRLALVPAAVADADPAVLTALAAELSAADVVAAGREALMRLPLPGRLAMLRAAFRPEAFDHGMLLQLWFDLNALAEGPLPEDLADAVLASPAWRSLHAPPDGGQAAQHGNGAAMLLAVAMVIPASRAARVLRDIGPLPYERRGPAEEYARFTLALAAGAGRTEESRRP